MVNSNNPYIIGETAFHHQGDQKYLMKLIDAADNLGLNAIKFHLLFDVEDYFVQQHPAFETIKQWMFSEEQWVDIFEYAHKKSLDIVALCNDVQSLEWVKKKCISPVKAVELHATGINDIFLLNSAASFSGTIMLGVGGSSLEQIYFAVDTIKKQDKDDIFLMYGFQNYPTDYKDVNLEKIKVLEKVFKLPMGYADHTDPKDPFNEIISASPILKGINVIEKHFTLDMNEERIDSQAAVSLTQMKKIKELCNALIQVNGVGGIGMSLAEKKYGDTGPMKKAIVARKEISEGQEVSMSHLAYKRTEQSSYVEQKQLMGLIGSKAKKRIEKDEVINYTNVEYQFKVADNSQFFKNKK